MCIRMLTSETIYAGDSMQGLSWHDWWLDLTLLDPVLFIIFC